MKKANAAWKKPGNPSPRRCAGMKDLQEAHEEAMQSIMSEKIWHPCQGRMRAAALGPAGPEQRRCCRSDN